MAKTAVVTGANVGIGYHTALNLAKKGYRVVLACRDAGRGGDAVKRIAGLMPDAHVELSLVDLSSLQSVKEFTERLSSGFDSLDLLVNNAAVMALPQRMLSKDGYEMQFATNHLGHFALTAGVWPLLVKSPSARVVTVSSIAHRYGNLRLDDLQSERSYEGWVAYGTTKLANLLFAFELARRVNSRGLPIISVATHPGVAKTNILASGPQMGAKVLRTYVSEVFSGLFAQSDARGALPTIHACLADDVRNGEYYGPDGFMQLVGNPTKVKACSEAHDQALAKELWSISENLTSTAINV